MPETEHFEKVVAHAEESLIPLRRAAKDRTELLQLYRTFLKKENHRIRLLHGAGGGGVEISQRRSTLLDVVINDLFAAALEDRGVNAESTETVSQFMTLIASGGYGRGVLNPGSDIDLLFLMPNSTRSMPAIAEETIEQILLMLYDVGFKVGHAVRSIPEALKFANQDHQTKTALLDARFIAGDAELFEGFEGSFLKTCLKGQEKAYLSERSRDIRTRHKKWGRTIHLQEPNVKEGCGGLRDYHNLIWVLWVLRQSRDLEALVSDKLLTRNAFNEIEHAYEFLMRVRNGLHYEQKRKSGDILTLRHQGILANNFGYPQSTILRRSEAFMRDYYHHTRNLYQHSTSLMQSFELEIADDRTGPIPFVGFLARRRMKEEHFDGFYSRGGLIYPESASTLSDDPKRLMRMFLHTQKRHLKLSPEIRRLFKNNWGLINQRFRRSRTNYETFEEILQHRGEVARILRQMHRVGFLGRYLPEFGALTDLVQHEFFHRYSADEHTLRCIEQLDCLASTEDPKEGLFQKFFREVEDPYILYLALILHDTGRAENAPQHEDASAMLASEVCTRLRIRGDRRRRLTFLVDHHLTFWRTATTRNLDDPETVREFADSMQNRSYLETLYLFTYVDSKGTNEEGWNDWKATLMLHLYRNTRAWFEDQEAFTRKFNRSASELKKKVLKALPKHCRDEVSAHFKNLPDRYFRFRGAKSVVRHLKLFHRFFEAVSLDSLDCMIPVVGWVARPDEGYSLFEVVGWNRHHLLAKVAGALAARNLNIVSADLFTREDDLVLDIFRVCTTNFSAVASKRDMEKVGNLIANEFDVEQEEVDFRTLIGQEQRPSPYREAMEIEIPQRAMVSNDFDPEFTVLELQAQDRIGLLFEIFTAIGDLDMDVVHARISTQAGAAIDRFTLIDTRTEKKVAEEERLEALQERIEVIVGI